MISIANAYHSPPPIATKIPLKTGFPNRGHGVAGAGPGEPRHWNMNRLMLMFIRIPIPAMVDTTDDPP